MRKSSITLVVLRLRLVGIALFVLSCLVAACGSDTVEEPQTSSLSSYEATLDFSPVRGEFQPLRLRRGDYTYRCRECHRSFGTVAGRKRLVAEHLNMPFDHGTNDYCLNCHHKTNREAYAAHDGSEILATEPARLCAKCHGLVCRDWLAGSHGRRSGFWNQEIGGRNQLVCIQCHDPHVPKFQGVAPMPGPGVLGEYTEKGKD